VTIGGKRGPALGPVFPPKKSPEKLVDNLCLFLLETYVFYCKRNFKTPVKTRLSTSGRDGGKKLKSGTQLRYNDCDSLFTQAEKNFMETATNKANADPISLIGYLRRGAGSKI
jgi:hypothetical protein